MNIRFPRFYGTSYLSIPVPTSKLYQSFYITISFKPESLNGRLLFASQEEDGKGDYMAVGLVDGKAVFRYVHYFHCLYFLPKKLLKSIICYSKTLETTQGRNEKWSYYKAGSVYMVVWHMFLRQLVCVQCHMLTLILIPNFSTEPTVCLIRTLTLTLKPNCNPYRNHIAFMI